MIVVVAVIVAVIAPMIVAALENENDAVDLIDTVDIKAAIRFLGFASMRSSHTIRVLVEHARATGPLPPPAACICPRH